MANTWHGKIAMVTGASSGIGAATARRLATEGLRVALVARRADRLEALAAELRAAGGQALAFPADLASPAQREALFEQVCSRLGPPEVLVNNAGFGYYGYLDQMRWEEAAAMIEVDAAATAHLTRLALPGMLARRAGHIINTCSVTALMPSQGNAMYAGSKAFVAAFTTALHRELGGSGVKVGAIFPGPVRTELFDNSEKQENGLRIPAERLAIAPEQVAGAIWSMLRRPRRMLIVPWYWAWMSVTESLFGWLMDRMGPVALPKRW